MPKKILLIDDDLLVLKSIGKALQTKGYDVTTASSGSKAIEMVGEHDYDMVMSDIRMPEMDGVETVDIIEKHYKKYGKTCEFLFITAFPHDERAKSIKDQGKKLMPKPFEVEDLLETIQLQFEQHDHDAEL